MVFRKEGIEMLEDLKWHKLLYKYKYHIIYTINRIPNNVIDNFLDEMLCQFKSKYIFIMKRI